MKRTIVTASSIVFVILLLGGAAFVAARMLGDQDSPAAEATGPQVVRSGAGGSQSFEIRRAEELPSGPADVRGLCVGRQDNALFVGTGQFTLNVAGGDVVADYDGPKVEVVVTHATEIYRDVTDYGTAEGEDGQIRQVLRPGSVDEIGTNSLISVWGEERGNRVFAEVLVYLIPLD